MAIYVKRIDEDYYVDSFSNRIGEEATKLFKAEVMDKGSISKEWFVKMITEASFDWGRGVIGNKEFAEALYEFLSRQGARITNFAYFLDEFGEEMHWGKGVKDLLRHHDGSNEIPDEEGKALDMAKRLFVKLYSAPNGIVFGFERNLSFVTYLAPLR